MGSQKVGLDCQLTLSFFFDSLILVSMRNLKLQIPTPPTLPLGRGRKSEDNVITVTFTTFYDPAHAPVEQGHICSSHSISSSWTVTLFPLLWMTPNFGDVWKEMSNQEMCQSRRFPSAVSNFFSFCLWLWWTFLFPGKYWTLFYNMTSVDAPLSVSIFLLKVTIFPLLNSYLGFPGGSDGKVSARSAGDPGSIPGSGRSPGEGNGNPLQYPCLENPMDGGAW